MKLHQTAIVDKDAVIARGVQVGPFSVIGKNCVIHEGTVIDSHVVISHSEIGRECKIGTGSILGGPPQISGAGEIDSSVKIGDGSFLGEYVSIHRAGSEGGRTVIGNSNYIMAYTHIAHDCQTESNVVLTSYTGLSGHVEIGEGAVIGGQTGVHQFVKIGRYSMVGGMSRIVKDVIPYYLVEGNPAVLRGLNRVGLKRNNFSAESRSSLKEAYKTIMLRGLNVSQALKRLEKEGNSAEVKFLVGFIRNSKRGVTI